MSDNNERGNMDELVSAREVKAGQFILGTVKGARRRVKEVELTDAGFVRLYFANGERCYLREDSPVTRINPPEIKAVFGDHRGGGK
jgi:hypothetical protein